jgi:Cu(I)/Ag(I) efflux system membrane protein CusA/SilA
MEMFETVINLKPESEWRPGMTIDKLIAETGQGAAVPRRQQFLDHADQGAHRHALDRHPHADRHQGVRQGPGRDGAPGARDRGRGEDVPGTTSAYAERITGGFYLDIEPDRAALARYGLSVGELQDVIATALGGEMVTTTVEGRERFGVIVRYPRELRTDPQAIGREVLVPVYGSGMERTDPAMGHWARWRRFPSSRVRPAIRTENALLSAYIYVDIRERDIGSYVADARQAVQREGQVPARLLHHLERPVRVHGARHRKAEIVVPLTLLIIFLLLYLNFRRMTETLIVMLSVPFALVGGVWLMWALGYNLSGGGGRRLHRPGRRRGRDRRGDADLPRSRLGGGKGQVRRKIAVPPAPTCTRR